ncbi:hypothetical protein DICPUDRAFT_6690, partial [Dictyostelium purpureum]
LSLYPFKEMSKKERYNSYYFHLKTYLYTGFPDILFPAIHCKDLDGEMATIAFTQIYPFQTPDLEIYFDQFYDFFERHIPNDTNQYSAPKVIHALEPPNIRFCSLRKDCIKHFNWSIGYEEWTDVQLNHGYSDLFEPKPFSSGEEFIEKKNSFIEKRKQDIKNHKFNDNLYYHYFNSSHDDQYNSVKKFIFEKSPEYDEAPLASWFCSKCNNETQSIRLEYVKEMMRYIRIDSYGECLKNIPKDPRAIRFTQNAFEVKQEIISNYKFYIAFENNNCLDYITEKALHALNSGSVPVIMGHPQILKYLPGGSYIFSGDFRNAKELVYYLKELDKNNEKYLKYFEWRNNKTEIENYKKSHGYPQRPNARNWMCPLLLHYQRWQRGLIPNKTLKLINIDEICLPRDFIKI